MYLVFITDYHYKQEKFMKYFLTHRLSKICIYNTQCVCMCVCVCVYECVCVCMCMSVILEYTCLCACVCRL